MAEEKIVKLNIDLLIPNPYQPRKNFNENSLKELALSIREYGILNPILVRQKDDKYEIIAGERRTRAAKLLNLKEIPAIIKDISDEKLAEFALIENLQRENITPIEEAMTYQTILKKTNKTEKELSEMIGKSQPFIANKLRLLNLPESIKKALIDKQISERHARSLLKVTAEERQKALLEKIIAEKLTVKELDNIINKIEVDDSEINSVVNDIMKSLNDSEKEKEEKESDNMNNGNFFPNYNIPNQEVNNNQASLNSMNMQTMANSFTYQPEQPKPAPQEVQPMATPEASPIPQVNLIPPTENANNQMAPVAAPEAPAPMQNNEMPTPIPEFNVGQPSVGAPAMPTEINNIPPTPELPSMGSIAPEPPVIQETQPAVDIPLFNTAEMAQPANPVVEPAVEMPQVEPAQPVMETSTAPVEQPVPAMAEAPLFNQELAVPNVEPTPQVSAPEPTSFEVPVTAEPVPETGDKLTEITNLLNNNGITYKSYSNDNGHCIIIEF